MRFLLFVFLFLISATQLFAKTVEVEMWTNFNGEKKNQRYEPLIVSIDEGDTVIWKSIEKSHNVEHVFVISIAIGHINLLPTTEFP